MANEAENIYELTLYIQSLLTPALGKHNHIRSYKVLYFGTHLVAY